MRVLDLLERAFVIICTPETWTYGAMARDGRGVMSSPNSPDTVCFCSIGALQKIMTDEGLNLGSMAYATAIDLLSSASLALSKQNVDCDIVRLNDSNPTFKVMLTNDSSKHYEVLSWWREAIAKAKQKSEADEALFN